MTSLSLVTLAADTGSR
ncbi:hypothetical protein YPPY65_2756, partial [Yersinia pestis PY-65]